MNPKQYRVLRHSRLWAVCTVLALGGAARAQVPGRDLLPDTARPIHYQLTLEPDADRQGFSGEAVLQFEVLRPTRTIIVNANGLVIASAALEDSGAREAASIAVDAKLQQARFQLAHPLARGQHQVRVRYRGAIQSQAEGLFALPYKDASGAQKYMLATQLEPGDARRLLPLWDEPALKATFEVTVRAPTELVAISNMPIAARDILGDGQAQTRFAVTPPMSSYLLFLALGDFESISGESAGVTHRVWARRGDAKLGQQSLETSLKVLPYYNEYFGLPYPLPKLDHVAVTGGSVTFAAMENWGAILYFDDYLLIDPALTSITRRKFILDSVAHEMAHQWFGNLVTMRWWDDIWLNESFASWLASKTMARLMPEWNTRLDEAGTREAAMALDARASSHPIVLPVRNAAESEQVFDSISYSKGELVLRMLERYMGEEPFRTGLRAYIAKHQFSTSTSQDLWRELATASGLPIQQIAHDFTTQKGVPLLRVLDEHCDTARQRTVLTVRQQRFGVDAESRRPQQWTLPVAVQVTGSTRITHQLIRGAQPQQIEADGCGTAIVNANGDAYFRTAYPERSYTALTAQLAQLAPEAQLQLLDDARALGSYGYLPLHHYFDLVAALPVTADPVVLRRAANNLSNLVEDARELTVQGELQVWARRWLRPVFARVGWDPVAGESDNLKELRASLVAALGVAEDADTVAEARRRFKLAENGGPALDGSIRRVITQLVARTADQATFDRLLARANGSRNNLESKLYYSTLAAVRDPSLASEALQHALDDSTPRQQSAAMIQTVAVLHPELCFDFVIAQRQRMAGRFTDGELDALYADVVRTGYSETLIQRLTTLARRELPPASAKPVAEAVSSIRAHMALRQQLAASASWLKPAG